ncbi:acyltransferase family protein [Streptomyces zingiberis]|uniref:Acyltransferase family protein n=1 Tax=Streptomyces zingiberis TaxID=2053010 RepID=A0ABX1C7I4_9ACTN|nr:acyltransferase family protein [Streptomyces zingiberis]NJQ03897.1 acyltransferase family protein [Streptomyces zingiberis]
MSDVLRSHGHRRVPLPPAEDTAAPHAPSHSPGTPHPGRSPTPPGGNGSPKKRDPFFDNAKYLAIVLVACGHAWQPLISDSRLAEAAYMFVYAFHMPAFIVVSGYFSRSFDMRADRLQRLITGVAVPYVIFEIAYTYFKRYADPDPGYPISLLDPWYLTWFLIALFIWRLTTPLWKVVRWPVPLALAIAVLASVSPDIGDDLDLQRVLQFLPFFVVGLVLKPEHFQLMRRREVRLLAIPVLAAGLVCAYWAAPRMKVSWLYHRDSVQELGYAAWTGPVMTLALFGCSMALTIAFLAWVPRREMWFTALGAGTLYGYLLHGFLAKGSRFWDWYDQEWLYTPWGAAVLTLAAAVIVTVLCTKPVQWMFRWAMEPKMAWAFRRDAAELGRGRGARATPRAGEAAGEKRDGGKAAERG